jgi:transglutaminase-like putative cysteine protease
MKAKQTIPLLLLSFLSGLTQCSSGQERTVTTGNEEISCTGNEKVFYFGSEMNGTLCGYWISRECTGILDGKEFFLESNEIIMKLSVLGQSTDNFIYTLFAMDPGTRRMSFYRMNIRNGNSEIVISSRITGDTAWFTASNITEPKMVLLSPDVILETGLRSPHLLADFVQKGMNEQRYRVYNPMQGEVIEKSYLKKGDTTLVLNDSTCSTIILEEVDLSTGQRSTIWLNRADGMAVKTLTGNRNIYLADESIKNRIRMVNYDDVIVAKVNRIIPEFSSVIRMKVRSQIEAVGEVITTEALNFPGQSFTGSVKDNLIDGIFEIEPKRYDGTNAPPFPPDFSGDTGLKKYLEPELVIESDDPILIAEARRITDGAQNSWEAVRQLSKWVANNIEGAIPGGVSAINTYKMRQGECGGHSRLMAAFCRAVGIPARLSVGCIYITKDGGCFAQHAWTEVYTGEGGWIAVDPTLFEIDYVDAGHIRLGEKAQFRPKEMEILEYTTGNDESVRVDPVPPQYLPFIGRYRFPDGKTRELTGSGECLLMYDPIRRSTEPLKFSRSGEVWKEDSGRFEFGFETDGQGEVTRMILYISFLFPKENPDSRNNLFHQ